jgi:hypothetical protein
MSYLNIPTSVLTDRRILVYSRQPSEVPVVVVIFLVVVVVV